MLHNQSLSIVTTLFRSEGTIQEFHLRAEGAAKKAGFEEVEFVYVDDGSPDNSLAIVLDIASSRDNIKVVTLSRNFGHHAAILQGLSHSSNDLVFLIDSDLEESPELLIDFLRELVRTSSDVVYGFQSQRRGNWLRRTIGNSYWKLFKSMSNLDIPSNICTIRLMTREYVDALSGYQERELSIGGIFALAGFQQSSIGVTKLDNAESTYSLRIRLWHAINSLVSFSDGPLVAIFLLGIFVTLMAFFIIIATLIWVLVLGNGLSGWNSLIISIWIIGGFIIISIGVIGLYIGKIFTESKNRPRVIERIRK